MRATSATSNEDNNNGGGAAEEAVVVGRIVSMPCGHSVLSKKSQPVYETCVRLFRNFVVVSLLLLIVVDVVRLLVVSLIAVAGIRNCGGNDATTN